jgi:hypothetical protein
MQGWRHSRWYLWLRRYGAAEIAGTLGSYLGFYAVALAGGGPVLSAYGAAVGENIGFYGIVGGRDLAALPAPRTNASMLRLARNLLTEFGTAELVDFLIVRPGVTWLAVAAFGPVIGVVVGKLAADAIFYTIAVTAFERLRRPVP